MQVTLDTSMLALIGLTSFYLTVCMLIMLIITPLTSVVGAGCALLSLVGITGSVASFNAMLSRRN